MFADLKSTHAQKVALLAGRELSQWPVFDFTIKLFSQYDFRKNLKKFKNRHLMHFSVQIFSVNNASVSTFFADEKFFIQNMQS